nr:hypothetical protein [uncultured Gimesia sp.]
MTKQTVNPVAHAIMARTLSTRKNWTADTIITVTATAIRANQTIVIHFE